LPLVVLRLDRRTHPAAGRKRKHGSLRLRAG
jgi:hypothetical protein